jgi:hypothetical protein
MMDGFDAVTLTKRETVHAETPRGGEKKLRDVRGSAWGSLSLGDTREVS